MKYLYDNYDKLILDPSLGEEETDRVLHQKSTLATKAYVWGSLSLVPFIGGVAGIFVSAHVGGLHGDTTGWMTFGIIAAACVASFVFTHTQEVRAERARRNFVSDLKEQGHLFPAAPLAQFVESPDIDDQTKFDAARIIARADSLRGRVAWATMARPEGRLATPAHEVLDEVAGLTRNELYQRAADLLDPAGQTTIDWLRGDI